MTYFETLITPKVKQKLLHENLTEFGELKWFSIFLSNGSNPILNIEHWGTELFAPNLNDQEIVYIKSIMAEGYKLQHILIFKKTIGCHTKIFHMVRYTYEKIHFVSINDHRNIYIIESNI